MKKINISSQLLVLFFIIILFATCVFSILTLTHINNTAEKEVYSRLSTYAYLIDDEGSENLPDMNIGFYINSSDETPYESPKLYDYVSNDELLKIVSRVLEKNNNLENPKTAYLTNGSFTKKGTRIYYVISTQNNLDDYTIVFTNSEYTHNMIRSVAIQMITVFFLINLIAIYIIYYWSNRFVKRIKNIQNHIINLPKNKYEIEYIDDSLDEIGELSRSIEQMRLEIGHNENTKQEMLQNLSHDFKTPIAVIKSYAEAYQDGMADDNTSKIIINQSEILKKKVNRLLQYNSLEYLDKTKPFEDINIKELILEVVQNYKFQTNIEFELDLIDDMIFKGYRENFYTVIDNIIDNAKRYAKTKIKIVLRKDRLRIYNDGEHIDEKFLDNIFKPYEKGSKGEFGLGMSIVKKTVDFFGLDLKVVNEPVGVSFIITYKK